MKTYARIFMGFGVLLWIIALLALPRQWKNITLFVVGIAIVGTGYALGREGAPKKEFQVRRDTLTEGRFENLEDTPDVQQESFPEDEVL